MTWPDERMAAFDIESTGVDPHEDRIVTAAVCFVGGGRETEPHTWLVDPGIEILEGATKVHGITTEEARAKGMPAPLAVQEILRVVSDTIARGLPIVGHNVGRFDLTMLDAEARRYGLGPLLWPSAELRVIDTLVLDKQVDRYRKGKRNLETACQHYDATIDGAHDSGHDAIAAARVAWRIGKRYPEIGNLHLDILHASQVFWAAEQAASLELYKRANGEPDAVIPRAWPIATRETVAA